jgi:hypothetical protein
MFIIDKIHSDCNINILKEAVYKLFYTNEKYRKTCLPYVKMKYSLEILCSIVGETLIVFLKGTAVD